MTLFIALGRMKLLFSGDGIYDPKKPVQYKLINGGWLRLSEAIPFIHAYNVPRRANSRVRFSISSGKKINQSVNVVACVNVREEGLHNDDDEFGEFDDNSLSCFRGLVLDISYRGFLPSDVPYGAVMIEEDSVLSVQAYRPINIVCWRRAICLEFMEKADVLEYYDQTVNSPSGAFYIPAVLRVPHLLQVVKRKRIRNTLSRKNIFYRDGYICQYCSATNDLTIDHVLPVARGGKWVWDNLVTACARCNSKKGQKTLEEANMNLLKAPKAPKEYEILAIPLTSSTVRMLRMRKETPLEWRQYLSKSYLDS